MSYSGLIDSVMIFFLHNQVTLSSEFVQGKWCEIITPGKHFVWMFLEFCVPVQEHKTMQKGWGIQEMMYRNLH